MNLYEFINPINKEIPPTISSNREIKNYLKENLSIDIRNNLQGDKYLVLVLEEDIISKILLDEILDKE